MFPKMSYFLVLSSWVSFKAAIFLDITLLINLITVGNIADSGTFGLLIDGINKLPSIKICSKLPQMTLLKVHNTSIHGKSVLMD